MPEYIAVPITTDPDALAQDSFTFLQDQIPGWLPQEGNFEVWLIEAMARMVAQVRDIESMVPTSIFRYFGKTLMNIPPVDAAPATGFTTWTVQDNLGYTIPSGTQVSLRDGQGVDHPFVTVGDAVIPAGSNATAAGAVLITAVNPGADTDGLSGTVTLLDVLGFVTDIEITAPTTGGLDQEDDQAYLNHLVEELQLMAPRPILPADFAALVKNVAGVYRATALDGYKPAVNEVQQLAIDATGGTFTVTFGGQTTPAQAYNVPAATLQTALQALSSIGANNVLVTGGPGGAGALTPYVITFVGTLGGASEALMTTNAVSLTGSAQTATVTRITAGSAAMTGVERYVTLSLIDETGNPVSSIIKTAAVAYMASHREVNFQMPIIDPTYTGIDVQVTVTAEVGTDHTALQNNIYNALANWLNPATWGLPDTFATGVSPGSIDPTEWENDTVVRYFKAVQVVNNVPGVAYISSLLTAVHGASPNTVDINLPGAVALPTTGSIIVTVN